MQEQEFYSQVHFEENSSESLLIHLKCYHLTSDGYLVKRQQTVNISKYLAVSSHCKEYMKPPCPLTNETPNVDYDVRHVSEEMMPEIHC